MKRIQITCAVSVLAAMLAGGCGANEYWEEPKADRGLVIILPGVQGEDEHSYSIRSGLMRGGVNRAIVVQTWGKPVPVAGLLINQVDKIGPRLEALVIADKIIAYQRVFPDKPVHIIGHSAGGALALFVAEGLADKVYAGAVPVEGLVLLSPSISAIYDLSKSMSMSNKGILNRYNPDDVALLGVATTVLGNLDGVPGPSAGLNGFMPLSELDRPGKRELYAQKLDEQLVSGYGSVHFASTSSGFIAGGPATWLLGRATQ